MIPIDPYRPAKPHLYECAGCRRRIEADSQPMDCSVCGGAMVDLSVPRPE